MSLESDGYVRFADPEAAECFREFHAWAASVSRAEFADSDPAWHEILRYYGELKSMSTLVDEAEAVPSFLDIDAEPVAAWVDTSRYEVSQTLLRGFFTGEKNFIGNVIGRVRELRHSWVELAEKMRDPSGEFSPQAASAQVALLAIELHRTERGSFATSSTSDGRHRTVAMVALRSPVIPALLRL